MSRGAQAPILNRGNGRQGLVSLELGRVTIVNLLTVRVRIAFSFNLQL